MGKTVPPVAAGAPVVSRLRNGSRARNFVVLVIAALAAFALLRPSTRSSPAAVRHAADPADEWQDNVWPYRQPEPWDISVDFPHPRVLEFDVDEGTWMNLDVHPSSGEIIFDLLGNSLSAYSCLI